MRLLQAYSKQSNIVSVNKLLEVTSQSRRPDNDIRLTPNTAKQYRAHEIDRLVERYSETHNMRQVAREFRISRETAAKHLASRGIDTSKSMKPADVAKARELYAQGMGSGRIGKLLGFDNKTILKAVKTSSESQ